MRFQLRALCAAAAVTMLAGCFAMSAFADNTEGQTDPKRGKATYFGQEIDETALYDDDALREIGFDDADIEQLKAGADVTYGVKYDFRNAEAYPDTNDGRKAKLDEYLADNTSELYDNFITEFYASKRYGEDEAVPVEGITDVKAMFGITPDDYVSGEEMLKKGTLKMLYLGGEKAVEVAVKPIPDPWGEGNIWFEFDYADRGDYAFLYFLNSGNNGAEPEPETQEPAEAVPDGNPKTGAGAQAVTALILSAALMTILRKRSSE